MNLNWLSLRSQVDAAQLAVTEMDAGLIDGPEMNVPEMVPTEMVLAELYFTDNIPGSQPDQWILLNDSLGQITPNTPATDAGGVTFC